MKAPAPIFETWYVMEDGTYGNPREIAYGEDGVLASKDGLKVAMRSADCPMSRSVEIDGKGKLVGDQPRPVAKDQKPAGGGKGGYKTRESKAD